MPRLVVKPMSPYLKLHLNKTEAKVLRGPKVGAPEQAIQGFIKTNNIDTKEIYE
jgi:hypothetical protein